MAGRLRIAVHKFSSCDGCQLAFLNLGEALLTLAQRVEIVHFAEAGLLDEEAPVDLAFVEGSVLTRHDLLRIQRLRRQARYLVTIGACATSGGIQALKNLAADRERWPGLIYAQPHYIDSLDQSTAIKCHVAVDYELWGCPVSSRQLVALISTCLHGVMPAEQGDKLCLECKRAQTVCVLVARGEPCLGPVTRVGCGALCPAFGRACYGCDGPAERAEPAALARCFTGLGLAPEAIRRRFRLIHPPEGGAVAGECGDG